MSDFEVNFSLEPKNEIEADFSINVSGVTEHNLLNNRDLPDQHPISAITGLQEALDEIPADYVSDAELESALLEKQDVISDLAQIRSGASLGSTAVQPNELLGYATEEYVDTELESKQDALTPTQMQAVNSGANTTNIGQISTNTSDIAGLQLSKQDVISDLATIRSGAALGATAVQPNDLATVATSGNYDDLINKPSIPAVNNATLTIQKNSSDIGTFTANASVDKIINIIVPTTAGEVSALPESTKYGASIDLILDTTDYKLTLILKDQDGTTLNSKVVDFPIESVVVNGSYDAINQKIVLTLQNGNTIDIPVGALIAGLQTEITVNNKLDADLVDDNTSTNKFVTSSEKTFWNSKQDAISDLSTIRSNATNGASAYTTIQGYGNIVTHNVSEFATSVQGALAGTALQPSDNISELNNDAGYITGISSSDVTSALGYTPQDTLVSGTNIKTINNVSLLGSGNIEIGGTIDTEISTSSTNAVQNKAIANYIISRGENLISNGFATLGNNYNFKSFVYDGADTYGAGGCFSVTSTPAGSRSSVITNELIPVDITQSYKLSYAVKNSTSTSTYDMLQMFDIDGYQIAQGNVTFVSGTTTTLAQELKNGDTKVYLTNISDTWHTGQPGTTSAQYYRALIFWNYKNSNGYQYPIEYYSRNWWFDLWNDDNDVDAVNGVITLKSAWNHGTFPAGTPVSQGNTSGGYVYGNSNYTPTANEWTPKSAIFTPDRFRNATSYVRLGWLYNYSQRPSNVFKISSVSLTQNLSIKDALKNTDYATTTVGGVVKVLSTYGTNINNGVVTTFKASNADIDAKTQQYKPIVPYNLDYAVKTGITTNTITLTSTEQKAVQDWLGVTDLVGDVETLINAL